MDDAHAPDVGLKEALVLCKPDEGILRQELGRGERGPDGPPDAEAIDDQAEEDGR